MFSTMSAELARERELELRREARNGRFAGLRALRRAPASHSGSEDVTIRVAGPADQAAVERLAQLDSRPAPGGYVLVAEVGREVRAALPVSGGEPVADPFRPTAELVALLRMRARQLRAGELEPARASAARSVFSLADR